MKHFYSRIVSRVLQSFWSPISIVDWLWHYTWCSAKHLQTCWQPYTNHPLLRHYSYTYPNTRTHTRIYTLTYIYIVFTHTHIYIHSHIYIYLVFPNSTHIVTLYTHNYVIVTVGPSYTHIHMTLPSYTHIHMTLYHTSSYPSTPSINPTLAPLTKYHTPD